jgi:hypothetical protein
MDRWNEPVKKVFRSVLIVPVGFVLAKIVDSEIARKIVRMLTGI